MIIALLAAGFLVVGLIGSNEYLSQQASSPESKASVASETAVQMPNQAPIKPPQPAPIEAVKLTDPLSVLVSVGKATQPAQQEEQANLDTIGAVLPPDDASGGSSWIEDDDNFDEWAK